MDKKYNNHIELKDYNPASGVYMKDTLKTTLEERIEIVRYCLSHNKDYKGTCMKYNCKYAQLYQWVKKYEQSGNINWRNTGLLKSFMKMRVGTSNSCAGNFAFLEEPIINGYIINRRTFSLILLKKVSIQIG